MNRLCVGKPSDWWEPADDGARLALMLCSVCPARDECGPEPEHGVIRGGVAWSDAGERLPLCPCGYPVPNPGRADCFRCVPRWDTRIPRSRLRQRRRRLSADVLLGQIGAMRADGLTLRDISKALDVPYSTLRDVIRRNPQAVDTGV